VSSESKEVINSDLPLLLLPHVTPINHFPLKYRHKHTVPLHHSDAAIKKLPKERETLDVLLWRAPAVDKSISLAQPCSKVNFQHFYCSRSMCVCVCV
jgi:hypothetical protein